jgi:hypothetical protein
VNRETIGKRATATTSVVYRRKKKQGQRTAPDNIVIYISVLRVAAGQSKAGDAIAVDVTRATGGNRAGVKVQSPRGGIYTGSRISASQVTVYVLEKQNSDMVILVYSPTAAGQETAARLAANIGNGEGLNDYPSTRSTVWVLPERPPGALTLVSLETQTREEMGLSQRDLNEAGNNEETRRWVEYISQFIPERATQARYVDNSGRRWEVIVYDYESTRRAWNTWWLLSWWASASDAKSVTVKDGDGLYIDTNEGRVLLFQRGPYLIFLRGPAATPVETLVAFGNSVQV